MSYVYRGKKPLTPRERARITGEELKPEPREKCDKCHYLRTGLNHKVLCGRPQ